MTKNLIAQVVVGLPLEGPFDYIIPQHLESQVSVGKRVLCVFARKKIVGIIVGLASESSIAHLNILIKVLDDHPIFYQAFLDFAKDFGLRFGCSTAEALFLSLPKYLRLPRDNQNQRWEQKPITGTFKKELWVQGFQAHIWDDLIQKIKQTLQKKQKVLVLVPDAATLQEAMKAFSDIAKGGVGVVLRQGTDKQDYEKWQKITTGSASLAIGFISSVLTPIPSLGLMIVIDEHSSFYKSERTPFYSASDVAMMRAEKENFDLVFISYAPSMTRWKEVDEGQITLIEKKETQATVRLMDLSNFKMKKTQKISPLLFAEIEKVLEKKEKVFLYRQASRGVEEIVQELQQRLAQARIFGFDQKSETFDTRADIVVGTQSILREKYHFRPLLSAVLDIDWELYRQDHQANFLTFSLMRFLQYISKETVILQTRSVQDSGFLLEGAKDIRTFYQKQSQMLQEAELPPFGFLSAVMVRSKDAELSLKESQRLYDIMNDILQKEVDVWEPQPDRTPVLRGQFRYTIMAKAKDSSSMMRVTGVLRGFRAKKNVTVTLNVMT